MKTPLKDSYVTQLAVVITTLFPQLINTAAYPFLQNAIGRDLGISPQAVAQFALLNQGAFTFGVLVGAAFMRRFNLRHVFLTLLAADVALVVVVSFAWSSIVMSIANVALGCVGGMFLMVAIPPLFTNFEPKYFPFSAAVMVPALFGAATLAPIVCAPLAQAGLWRPLFWGEAAVLAAAFVLALFTIAPRDPQDADMPVDWFAIVTGGLAMAAIYTGAMNASSHEWTYLPAVLPFGLGVCALVALFVVEYRKDQKKALLPVGLLTVGYAVIGFFGATAGDAIYVADSQIMTLLSTRVLHLEPMQIAASTWPSFAMTIVAGILFAVVLKTKWVPLFTLFALCLLCVGSALLLQVLEHPNPVTQSASRFLIGFGAAATITPGLFTVGLSLPRQTIVRGIAAVEVLRLAFGFICGPLAQHTAVLHPGLRHGITTTMAYIVAMASAATIISALLLLKYYRNPHVPDIVGYVKEGRPAFDSPPL